MLVIGLGCLGWVGYQYFGTNIVSKRAFEQEKGGLRAKWDQQQDQQQTATPSASRSTTNTRENKAPTVIPGDAIALLRIPAFGAEYEVPILAGTEVSTLSRGVGHYETTALPGRVGNFAIAGHRVTHGQPFAKLLELDIGAEVIVETREAVYTYVVDVPPRDLTVDDTETCVLDPAPCAKGEPRRALLTLTTCEDLFSSADRSIGFAHLESTEKKS
ncbi:MAG: hypothetical protein AVDCRST_MAG75-772 [uncultured Propionibacteriaceae bacterium]|uniref:Class E sortase n=1 Tax=uncultured Propionibacteriaceae bacterium TaxID=257457 RepID=A0A6J4N992_9ACTN|nr:MAG: hypothetical protein AVDCRST_MAG75-772 [uncultured Propionibacteriaceae bacterium]